MVSRAGAAPSVLYVDQSAEIGGAELYLLDVVTHVGHPAQVCVFEEGPFSALLREHGVSVTTLPGGSMRSVRRANGLAAMLRAVPGTLGAVFGLARLSRANDVVYANTMKAFIVAALAKPFYRKPLIWNLHDLLTAEHFSGTLRRVAVTLANFSANLVIANSHATARSFREAGGRTPVEVVHNGIAAGPFDAIDTLGLREALVAETGLDPARPIVGVFSRLAAWKGQHVLVEALALAPEFQAVIVGGALFGEEAYEAELRERIAALGLVDRVRLLGFRRDVARLMKSVDIVAHTSVAAEPFGRVIVEGMLAGRPVVASRGGGVPEIVREGEAGLLVSPGDAGELAAALERLRDPVLREGLCARADAVARRSFSVEACAGSVERLIRQICKGCASVR